MSEMLWSMLWCALVALATFVAVFEFRLWMQGIPGRFYLPIVGETLQFLQAPRSFMRQRFAKASIFRSSILGDDIVFLSAPESVKAAILAEGKSVQLELIYTVRELVAKDTVLDVHGAKHRDLRKILSVMFKPEPLAELVNTLAKMCEESVQKWKRDSNVPVHAEMQQIAFKTMTRLVLGEDFDNRNGRKVYELFLDAQKATLSLPIDVPFTNFGKGMKGMNMIRALVLDEVQRQRNSLNQSTTAKTLLQHMLVQRVNLSDEEISRNFAVMLWGGHDTTAAALARSILELCQRPDILAKITSEQEEKGLWTGEGLTLAKLKKLPYLDTVIDESIRINHPIMATGHRVVQPISFEGFELPKGSLLCISYDQLNEGEQ